MNAVEGVQDVHDLHVWSISSSTCAMTVHIKVRTCLCFTEVFVCTISTSCSCVSVCIVTLDARKGRCHLRANDVASSLYLSNGLSSPYTIIISITVLNHTVTYCTVQAYNPQDALVACHKVAKDMNIQHATIQVQDAALTKNQKCLSYMCDSEKTCVVATPSNYLTGGF